MLDSKTRMGKQNWVNSFFWFYPYSSLTKMLKISTQNFCLWKFINLFLFNRKHTLYETKTEGNFLIIIIIISAQNGPFNEWILGILFPNQSSQVFFNENYEKTPKWIMDFLFLLVMFWTRQKKRSDSKPELFFPKWSPPTFGRKKIWLPGKTQNIYLILSHTHTQYGIFEIQIQKQKKTEKPENDNDKNMVVVMNCGGEFIHSLIIIGFSSNEWKKSIHLPL